MGSQACGTPWTAAINLRKHGVSFETATEVFADPFLFAQEDIIQDGDQRWQAIGMKRGLVLLLVVFIERRGLDEEVIRIITARKVNKYETQIYRAQGQNY